MADIDISKIEDLFDMSIFEGRQIHIIGVGATGSHIAKCLAHYGFEIHIYDFDNVEKKNTYNQYYRLADIGQQKVYALSQRLHEEFGVSVIPHNERVTDASNMNGIIVTAVDSVDTRRNIGLTLKSFDFLIDPGIPMNIDDFLFASGRTRLVVPPTIDEWIESYGDETDEQMKQQLLDSIKGCEAQQFALLCEEVAIQSAKIIIALLYLQYRKTNGITLSSTYIIGGVVPNITKSLTFN